MFLAIDASTKSTGIAVFDNSNLVYYDCFTAYSSDVITRIQNMTKRLDEVLTSYSIDTIIIEEVRPDQGEENPKTMKALFWLQAAIAFLLHDKHPQVKIEYVYPNEWRHQCGIKTGKGIFREELKKADIKFVNETYGINIQNDDIADAICIGYAFLHPVVKEVKFGK